MRSDLDRYEAFYAEKLWNLLPAIYRAEDSDDFDRKGPLRELVERVAAQVAVVRRGVDRLWEDQSIETCDDWIIPYLGELLATNVVPSLGARGQRLDVAKTIYYRRRKGTVGLLEELATDITGWGARVVEFFRRMARTRHGFDPAVGMALLPEDPRFPLQCAEELIGERTHTGAGGFADLRNAHGAALTDSAFDEFFHTADVRRGRGATGRHNIPRLGVFVWRLRSLPVKLATAVVDTACPNQCTFDPTGRDVPLYAAGDRRSFDRWVSPLPHELPAPITAEMMRASAPALYTEPPTSPAHPPTSLAVYQIIGPSVVWIPFAGIAADPHDSAGRPWIDVERGRIVWPAAPGHQTLVSYHYGFSSEIGAGAYDRLAAGDLPVDPQPSTSVTGGDLVPPLQALAGTGSLVIQDSLTYPAVDNLAGITDVTLRGANQQRPLIRLAQGSEWTFTGAAGAKLSFDGMFVSGGGDLILRGEFDRVTLKCCTLDPGSWNADVTPPDWRLAADGRPLRPTRLRILGHVRELVIDRSIVGPILTEPNGTDKPGRIETLLVSESIVQATDPAGQAIVLDGGEVRLERCTLLGPARVHRLDASECILHDVVTVEDRQHGCVRFSAWAEGSALPRQYESVTVRPRAGLFVSRDFGQPGYGQLLTTAGGEIAEGAEDGSEMGAFWREKNAIKERSLLIKYQEYLPLGIEPVVIHVT